MKKRNAIVLKGARGTEKVGNWINDNRAQVALQIPKGVDADRLARVFLSEVGGNSDLMKCSPRSLIGAFLQASQYGLEIGGHLGQAYMVPFGNKAQLLIGYKGLVALAYRSGMVSTIHAYDVREADDYEPPMLGTSPRIVHMPARDRVDSKLVAAYAVVRMRGSDSPHIEWMWLDEILAIKERSRGSEGRNSPWNTELPMMARKTALRRALKVVPMAAESSGLHNALSVDENAGESAQTFSLPSGSFSPPPSSGLQDEGDDLPADFEGEAVAV
jgi:recombination protein RecT